MSPTYRKLSWPSTRGATFLVVCALAHLSASAQTSAESCTRAPSAPDWLPCGPDRILSEADLKAYIFKPNQAVKMLVTGVPSGRKFRVDFYPGGKFEAGLTGGPNIGKEWKLDGAKLCRAYYGAQFGNGRFDCGPFELAENVLYLVDGEGNKSPVTSLEFKQP